MAGSAAHAPSLFICGLCRRIGVGNQGPRLPEAKAELAEEPLALPHLEGDRKPLAEERRQGLAVPDAPGPHTRVAGRLAEGVLHLGHMGVRQPTGPARARPLGQARKPVPLEALDPILDRARPRDRSAPGPQQDAV